jgi:dihydrolipoamide dehydrogenase
MHIAIIGAYGSAGAAAAKKLSGDTESEVDKVTLIDGGEPGGLCILRGCMPSKAVLSSAKASHSANKDPRVNANATIDVEKTIQHKNKYIQSFAEHRESSIVEMAEEDGVQLIEEDVKFRDENLLVTESGQQIEPDYTILATGSEVNVPDTDGIEDIDYLTSSDILQMTDLPESVIVMGFGTIGLEMSAYLASAGVDVKVVEHDKSPLDEASDDFGFEILDIYEDKFDIDIRTNTYEESIESTVNGVKLHIDGDNGYDTLDAERLCLFTGRVPNVDNVSIENAGVSPTGDWLTDSLRVKGTDSVYAAGDVTGDRMILHIAKEQASLAVDNIIKNMNSQDENSYESPEHLVYFCGNGKYPYARFGATGDMATNDPDLVSVHRDASDDGIFNLKEASYGIAKLVVDRNTGVVKGYEGLHLHSDVMVKSMQIVIENNMDVRDIPSRAYHPTTPELMDGLIREAKDKVEE